MMGDLSEGSPPDSSISPAKQRVRAVPRQPCIALLFCAMAGILLSEYRPCHLPLALCAVASLAVSAIASRRLLPFWLLVVAVFLIRHELDWRRAPGRSLAELAASGMTVVRGTGIVTDDPAPAGFAGRGAHYRFPVRITSLNDSIKAAFPALLYWNGPAPAWGDAVQFTGEIGAVPPPRNPGEFDMAAYSARRGIFAELKCDFPEDNHVIAHDQGNAILAWSRRCRDEMQRRLTLGLEDSPEISGLVQTLALGQKKQTSQEDRDLFQRTGTMHLFVVNGLHIALLAGVLAFILNPFGIRRRAFAAVIIPLLCVYALLTGLSPGSVRATTMAAVLFGATFVDRKPFSFNTFATAALLLLGWDTNELFEPGFQFSFGVVFSILCLAPFFQRRLIPLGLPDAFLPRRLWSRLQCFQAWAWRKISGLIAVTTAASIGSAPFTAGYFHLLTPSALVTNLLMVPMAMGILGEAVFSLAASVSLPGWVVLFNNVNWLLAWLMLGTVRLFSHLPGSYIFVPDQLSPPACEITVLDLSPGQCIFVRGGGGAWLVDCGSASAYARTVRPFLQARGVNHLDGLVLTHGSSLSLGGARTAIADFNPAEIVESTQPDRSTTRRALHLALEQAGRPKTLLEGGDEFTISGDISAKVLFPPADYAGRTAADKALVLLLGVGSTQVLLLGDAGAATERGLRQHLPRLRAEIVVLGSGSDETGGGEFVAQLHPAVVIRGAPGYFSERGTGPDEVANAKARGITLLRQEETGAVIITSAGSFPRIQTFIGGAAPDFAKGTPPLSQ